MYPPAEVAPAPTSPRSGDTLRPSSQPLGSSSRTEGWEPRWTLVGGLPMFALVHRPEAPGVRLPVVLVHGLGMSHRYLMPTARALAPTCTVYVPDLPGHGPSIRPPHAQTVGEQTELLAGWLDAMGLDRAAFLGNSMGCQVIVELAAARPERVAGAVLVAPTMDPRAPHVRQLAARLVRDMVHERPRLWWVSAADYLRTGPLRVLRTLESAVHDPIACYLPAVRCPVLVVNGSLDPIVPQRWARRVAARLPRGRLVVVPGAPHAVNYSRPQALLEVALPFLAGLDPEPRPGAP